MLAQVTTAQSVLQVDRKTVASISAHTACCAFHTVCCGPPVLRPHGISPWQASRGLTVAQWSKTDTLGSNSTSSLTQFAKKHPDLSADPAWYGGLPSSAALARLNATRDDVRVVAQFSAYLQKHKLKLADMICKDATLSSALSDLCCVVDWELQPGSTSSGTASSSESNVSLVEQYITSNIRVGERLPNWYILNQVSSTLRIWLAKKTTEGCWQPSCASHISGWEPDESATQTDVSAISAFGRYLDAQHVDCADWLYQSCQVEPFSWAQAQVAQGTIQEPDTYLLEKYFLSGHKVGEPLPLWLARWGSARQTLQSWASQHALEAGSTSQALEDNATQAHPTDNTSSAASTANPQSTTSANQPADRSAAAAAIGPLQKLQAACQQLSASSLAASGLKFQLHPAVWDDLDQGTCYCPDALVSHKNSIAILQLLGADGKVPSTVQAEHSSSSSSSQNGSNRSSQSGKQGFFSSFFPPSSKQQGSPSGSINSKQTLCQVPLQDVRTAKEHLDFVAYLLTQRSKPKLTHADSAAAQQVLKVVVVSQGASLSPSGVEYLRASGVHVVAVEAQGDQAWQTACKELVDVLMG